MTCKCLRQEYVVRCYEKCGDDEYYQRMMEGEKGQQQIFCSQKKAGEPEDMPIIGSDTTAAEPAKKPPPQKSKGVPDAQPKPAKPQQSPKDESKEQEGVAGEGQYEDLGAGSNLVHGGSLGSNSGSIRSDRGYGRVIRNVDMEGRASALAGTGLVWAAAAAIHLALAP
ncbi:hypothetical protein GQ54DRAFT_14636 [Martensiomyces pterosporus]|nr:hypothetical protein GQ54DRAFT_14636 [Martensiomyces pterosporus]